MEKETKNIWQTLTAIQNELKAPKNQYNNFGKYNYRSCEDILEALKPLLAKHDCSLTITDSIKEAGGTIYVQALAVLVKGKEVIPVKSCAGIDIEKKGMDVSQCFGSSSSYARKYALNGLFLIDDTKDADTTNTGDKEVVKKKVDTTEEPRPTSSREPAATQKQVDFLKKLMTELELPNKNEDKTIFGWGIKRVSDLISEYKDEIDKRAIEGTEEDGRIKRDTETMEKAAEEKGVPFVNGDDVPDEEYEKDQIGDVW